MLPRDRFFVEGRHAPSDIVDLPRDDARKIGLVLRMKTGDRIAVIDSAGQQFVASIETDGSRVRARLGEAVPRSRAASALEISLAQAIPKGQKMDFVVEKATELGIARLIPVRSSRSIADASTHKRERWQKLAKAAAQQSGGTTIPVVEEALEFPTLCARMPQYDAALFAWELGTLSLRNALAATRQARTMLVVIGPEGGFSHDEAEMAIANGAAAVSLGRRILRTETAAVVALAAILYEAGEL